MFDHILVPIRSAKADGALIEASLGLAKLCQAEVTLLHVVARVAGAQSSELKSFHKRLVDAARRSLAKAAKLFMQDGIPVHSAVSIGDAAVEVLKFASEHGVDLIVMGSHSVQTDRIELGWGTTSYKVGLMCQCPVLLVKDLKATTTRRRK